MGEATTYDIEWAKAVLAKTGTSPEYRITRIKDLRDASTEFGPVLGLREARDLVLQLETWTAADALQQFAEFVVSLDDSDNPEGLEARRTITLTKLVEMAREALGRPA